MNSAKERSSAAENGEDKSRWSESTASQDDGKTSVSVDVVIENGANRSVLRSLYDNLRVEGSLVTCIHPNLHKSHPYPCTPELSLRSSETDLVISRDETSVRFGEYDHMTFKGHAVVSNGPSVEFPKDVGDGLGLHYSLKRSPSVTVYTEEDYLQEHREKRGVVVFAPNFVCPAGDEPFTPVRTIDRPDCLKVRADRLGDLRDLRVKGSLIIDKFVVLHKDIGSTVGGWFFGNHSQEWYRPPPVMIVREKQMELEVAEPGDLVISRGNASVLIRSDGSTAASGVVALLLVPVSYGEGPVHVNAEGLSSSQLGYKTVIVFQ